MTYIETVEAQAQRGAEKAAHLRENPAGFRTGALMAGVYVGFGIVLIFALGSAVPPGARLGLAILWAHRPGCAHHRGCGQ